MQLQSTFGKLCFKQAYVASAWGCLYRHLKCIKHFPIFNRTCITIGYSPPMTVVLGCQNCLISTEHILYKLVSCYCYKLTDKLQWTDYNYTPLQPLLLLLLLLLLRRQLPYRLVPISYMSSCISPHSYWWNTWLLVGAKQPYNYLTTWWGSGESLLKNCAIGTRKWVWKILLFWFNCFYFTIN